MKINGIDILLGSDPELFVHNGEVFISGHDLIPGTKAEPYEVRGGAVQVDGTALEFNTKPARGAKEFSNTVEKVVNQLGGMIPRHLELLANPTAHFAKKYFDQLPEKAKELGCDPDYNAYTGKVNKRPDGDVYFRTGAGHIHIGWTNVEDPMCSNHLDECRAIVQALDIFLGAPSILLDRDEKRRTLYGKAGAFRPKIYGVEYRVLSNFWVMDDKLRRWVFNNTKLALTRLMDKNHFLPDHKNKANLAINLSDKVGAKEVINKFNVPLPRTLPIYWPECRPFRFGDFDVN